MSKGIVIGVVGAIVVGGGIALVAAGGKKAQNGFDVTYKGIAVNLQRADDGLWYATWADANGNAHSNDGKTQNEALTIAKGAIDQLTTPNPVKVPPPGVQGGLPQGQGIGQTILNGANGLGTIILDGGLGMGKP